MNESLAVAERVRLTVLILNSAGEAQEVSGVYSIQSATTQLCRFILGKNQDKRVVGWYLSVLNEPRYI